jgi:hypothetical protein
VENKEAGFVKEILNNGQPIKQGFSEKTKSSWEKYKILTDQGITAYGFGPVKVGDKIEVWDDTQYGMQFKVDRPDKFKEINDKLDEVLQLLKGGSESANPKVITKLQTQKSQDKPQTSTSLKEAWNKTQLSNSEFSEADVPEFANQDLPPEERI